MQDLEGNLMALNKAGEAITGYSRSEALGTKLFELLAPDYVETIRSAMQRHLLGEPSAAYEIEIQSKDGKRVALDVVSRLILDHGRPVGMQAIARDVTERQRLERDLRQAQKMEAIGQLAGGVAHDFNNLLTVIRGYSSLLTDQFEESDWRRQALQEMDKAADRAATLTRQLLAFSRRQVLKPAIIDLNMVIAEMTTMLRRLIPEDIELVSDLEPELGTVRADAGQMEQVLLNLAVNARDAMPSGGRIVIETANVESSELPFPNGSGPHVALSVADTGIGMDAATKARIFEPFFTTKERGKGTGLGLATVYGIVQQSGGFIEVESAPGEGARFRVFLPRVEEPRDAMTGTAENEYQTIAPATILLVEDDRAVRKLAQHCLEGQGYRVLSAGSCAEALRICLEDGHSVHLLVTDVVMPDMNGRELAARLSSTYPHLKIIFMSGYMDKSVSEGLVDDTAHFLQKPFRPVDLNRKVRDVLSKQK
jgi:two-component system, cell cycle sensor histidine kinase and response regulator CckA